MTKQETPTRHLATGDDWAEAMAEVKRTASLDFEAKPQLSIGELTHLFRHRLHDARNSEEFHRGQATAYLEMVSALERVIVEREVTTGDGK